MLYRKVRDVASGEREEPIGRVFTSRSTSRDKSARSGFPTNMYYDLNVRGGTFIVEAATAASPTAWVTMVATESGGTTKLGREGILNAMPVATGAVGNVALSKTVYTLAPASAGGA